MAVPPGKPNMFDSTGTYYWCKTVDFDTATVVSDRSTALWRHQASHFGEGGGGQLRSNLIFRGPKPFKDQCYKDQCSL